MKTFSLSLVLLLASISGLTAQTDPPDAAVEGIKPGVVFKHELGIAAGLTTGFGPSYRLWANRIGGQVCFTPINDGSMELYSAGLTLMFSMAKTETSNFYLYQGNHFLSRAQYLAGTYEYQYLSTGPGVSTYTTVYVPPRTEKNQYLNNGVGIGIEVFHKDRNISPFGFNLMCGLAGYRNFTRANFTGEIALMYKFK
jgi:hypothetical protein